MARRHGLADPRGGGVRDVKPKPDAQLVQRHCEELSCPPKPAFGRRRMRRSNPAFFLPWHFKKAGLLRGACHRAALCADPLARNDGIRRRLLRASREAPTLRQLRQINPSGKISLNPSGKSLLQTRPSHPARGAYRDRHETRDGMRWTRAASARTVSQGESLVSDPSARRTTALFAYGKTVWS